MLCAKKCMDLKMLQHLAHIGPTLCNKVFNTSKPCNMSWLRRRQINHWVSKLAGCGRNFYVFFNCVRSYYDLRRWQKLLCSSSVSEVTMFFVGVRSYYVLRRWQKFLCSRTVAEVPMFSLGGRRFTFFFSGRNFMFSVGGWGFCVLFRWQKFLCCPSVAEISVLRLRQKFHYSL